MMKDNSSLNAFLKSLKDKKDFSLELIPMEGCPTIPGFHYHQARLSFDSKDILGTGEAFSESLSQRKAIGEVLERWPLLDKDFVWEAVSGDKERQGPSFSTSNGCAFHLQKELALFGAKKEAYERHIILKAWLNRSPLPIVHFPFLSSLQQKLNSFFNRVAVITYYFPNPYRLPLFCTEISSPEFRFFGYGADLDKVSALHKSYFEAWRFFWDFSRAPKKVMTEDDDPILAHYYHYLSHPECEAFAKGEPISFSKISSLESFEYTGGESFRCDLSQKGISGFVFKHQDPNLIDLWSGALKKSLGKRRAGEYHPIA